MNTFTFTGEAAEVRWGYHRAAALGSWELEAHPGGFKVTAPVLSSDAFRLSQQPIAFVVPREQGPAWRWPITSLQIVGPTFVAALGPQEEQ